MISIYKYIILFIKSQLLNIYEFPLEFISEIRGINTDLFCHSCVRRNPVFCFFNRQSTTGNRQCSYFPPHLFPLPAGSDHYPHLYIRSRYILIFEENYGWFAALSSLLTPNFNALLNPIQGLLRKPRLLLTVNSLHDFFSTVFYEKISGIPAS